jgi:uncharacterized protein
MSTKPPHESRSALIPTRLAAFESRADGETPTLIAGYGAVYYRDGDAGSEYRIDVDLVERLQPGCFDAFLASDRDCYCAPYHDENRVLGRRSRLMKLASDDRGLRYSLPYDASDPDHQAIAAKMRRGDVSGSSVRFLVLAEEWRRDEATEMIIREVIKAEILHLGPVIGEAYSSTTAEIRTADGGWEMLQSRKAAFMATESQGHDSLLIEIDALLLD